PSNDTSTVTVNFIAPVASITVTSNADSGPGSLRQAILDANSGFCAAPCLIAFNLSTTQINLLTTLPSITASNVTLDGSTQPGFSGTPLVSLNGSALSSGDGLVLTGSGITIRSLSIGNFPGEGIVATGASGDFIINNFI